jgi:hypothetical protein
LHSGSGVGASQQCIIGRCDWKSTSALRDPAHTRFPSEIALPNSAICIEFRKCARKLKSAPTRPLIATKSVEIEYAGQEDI